MCNSDVAGLQNEDGSFSGDMWGEIDTRYSFLISFDSGDLRFLKSSLYVEHDLVTILLCFS